VVVASLECQARGVDSTVLAALISAGAAIIGATLTWYAARQQHREARRAEERARRHEAIEAFRRRLAGAMEAIRALIDTREHGGENDEFDTARWLLGELGPEATLVGIHLSDEAKPQAAAAVEELRQALDHIRSEDVRSARDAYRRAEKAATKLNDALASQEA
jgi:hypothetical protein